MAERLIVGLGYRAQQGKDLIGAHLCDKYGFKRVAFADPLKRACKEIFGWHSWDLTPKQKTTLDEYWKATPRVLLQDVGTAMREYIHPDVWVHAAFRQIETRYPNNHVVITDVRFPNEAEAVRENGGKLLHVIRPGVWLDVEAAKHESEHALDKWTQWDASIINSGTVRQLLVRVDRILHEWMNGARDEAEIAARNERARIGR